MRKQSVWDSLTHSLGAGTTSVPWQDCFPVWYISSYTEANTFIISDVFPVLDGASETLSVRQHYMHMKLIGSDSAHLWSTDAAQRLLELM